MSYKLTRPKESITFVENKEDIEELKSSLYILKLKYKELKRKFDELKKRYIKQNRELLEYMKGEKYDNDRSK